MLEAKTPSPFLDYIFGPPLSCFWTLSLGQMADLFGSLFVFHFCSDFYSYILAVVAPHPISLPVEYDDEWDGDGAVDGDHRPGLTPLACHSLPAEPINPTQLFTLLSCSLLCNQSLLASQ